ncbi:histidine phosphatase family protein [Prevotella cerevisiae]|jgi:hypothetical protein|uniref:Multiple inositol polyphosphate phosphatase 1 n=1 Tax=Segatella cerevisiae TaxID=2053716 RepID=A0ABT1BUM7_9BACT|nr:histidine-type phosphatase [Segatella cerevisiae]MCH3994759.1 histidine phosphatase family protein [Prevotella sp.]MCO6024779.1 histidine phosphatase family protein [Segatella cerevisiae]
MKRFLSFAFILCFAFSLNAQQARQDFKVNRCMSASNYYAYPGPQQKVYTPAPAGYTPFYISHYGRHGSRYLIGAKAYDLPYFTLLKADSLNELTPTGKDLLKKLRIIRDEAMNRDGELTLLGARQHKEIAARMYKNFPQVFEGKTNIDAKSTIVIRCILSMENELQQLLVENPQLQIRHDASMHDMYYLNFEDDSLFKQRFSGNTRAVLNAFVKKHDHYERVMREIFKNDDYWQHHLNASRLNRDLFSLASNMQSTDLKDSISLYNLFNDDEVYNNWLMNNAYYYVEYGACPWNGGNQPYSQRNLLRNIIHQADSCIVLKHPGATLRFGHDTMVMPLTCLLDLDGMGLQESDFDKLPADGWCDYKIFPMACNIQFIFYRRYEGDKDILFKVLRNENEAKLPIKTDCAPYYHWKDFKAYYLNKLDSYDRKAKQVN